MNKALARGSLLLLLWLLLASALAARDLAQVPADGSHDRLVQQYYPAVFDYFPEFFAAR